MKYRLLAYRLAFWLAAELILNFVGLDNLADCEEFLRGQGAFTSVGIVQII